MKHIPCFYILFFGFICLNGMARPNPENIPELVAQEFKPNTYQILELSRTSDPIQIDGDIESFWKQSASFSNFTEYLPIENRKPAVETKGYVTYDDEYLYVSFICDDPNISDLRASFADRDHIYGDDWVCVSIDPDRDSQKAYEFYANARGIQGDRLWQLNGDEDDYSFDLVWNCRSQIDSDFWSVEMRIPFSSLRFPKNEVQKWSVHFMRYYPRENQYRFSWMPITQNNSSFMGQAGDLTFKMPQQTAKPLDLEILPYVITTQHGYRVFNAQTGMSESWLAEKADERAGFGVKYGLSSNMIVDFTYNPDFSQIESDAGQISINNPFALFYSEKRPFFQEGSEIYVVDQYTRGIALDQYVNLFHSRSINDPIVAGKLTGKVGRISLGITSAYDQNTPFIIPFEESSSVLSTDKNSINNIVRAKMDLGKNSSVGLFISNRTMKDIGTNTVGALDATIRLSDKDMFTAIIAMTHTKEPDDSLLSQTIGDCSFTIGNKVHTGHFDGESFYGQLLRAKLARASLHWTAAIAYQDFSPGFRADNGFIWTTGYRNIEAVSGYAFRWEDHKLFTMIEPRVSFWRKYNYDGVVKDTGFRPTLQIQMPRQISVYIGSFVYNRENLRGKQFEDARQIWFWIGTNMTKWISTETYFHVGKEINRMGVDGDPYNPFEVVPTYRLNAIVTLRPTAKIMNQLEIRNFSLWQKYWSRQIMGQRIWRNTFSYNFNRNLFIRLIAEYNHINLVDSQNGQMTQQATFSFEPLLSYKLNAFSVFYLGAHLGGWNNWSYNWEEMQLNDQTVYMKLQYLIGF